MVLDDADRKTDGEVATFRESVVDNNSLQRACEVLEKFAGGEWAARTLVVLATALLLASFFNTYAVASHIMQTSDSVQGLLAGEAVAHGHLLLPGWHLAPDNFFFTDTLPFAAFEFFVGPRSELLILLPTITYTLFVLAALIACIRPSRSFGQNLTALAILTAVLGMPPRVGDWNPALMADFHLGTVLGALAALIACVRVAQAPEKPALGWAVILVLIASATIASDPSSLVFCFLPTLVVLATDLLLRPPSRGLSFAIALMVLAVVLGILLPGAIARSGGFVTERFVSTKFVSAPLLGRNLEAITFGILNLAGAEIFGRDIRSIAGISAIMHCATFLIVALALLRTMRGLMAPEGAPLLDRVLIMSILSLLLSCLVSEQFARELDQDVWLGGASLRYLPPAFFFAAVLAGRQVPAIVATFPTCRARLAANGVLLLLASATLAGTGPEMKQFATTPNWIQGSEAREVALWLNQHGLTQGVGEYWSASLVMALSKKAVTIGAVIRSNGRLTPYLWAVDTHWYDPEPEFVIWRDDKKSNVDLASVRSTYGNRLDKVVEVEGYHIAILNRSIRAFDAKREK